MSGESAFDIRHSNVFRDIANLDSLEIVEDIYGDELDAIGDDCQTVTSVVRQQYLLYLRKTLITNYQKRLTPVDDQAHEAAIDMLAARLERQAVISCMVFPVYQNAMLTTIKSVRDATNGGRAFCQIKFERELEEQRKQRVSAVVEKQMVDVAVQVDVDEAVVKGE